MKCVGLQRTRVIKPTVESGGVWVVARRQALHP